MSFIKAKPQAQEATEFNSCCSAYGCQCIASISLEGSRWTCRYHAFVPQDQWQEVTHKLRDNEWLAAFIDDMQLMDRRHQDWRLFATEFWKESDPYCVPDPNESASVYQNRTRAELAHRVGALSKRPRKHLALGVVPSGPYADAVAV